MGRVVGEGAYRSSDPGGLARERTSSHGDMLLSAAGVMEIALPADVDVDGERMRQILDAVWDFAPGRRPLLIDGRHARGVGSEAREVMTTGQAVEWTSALAVVVGSIATAAALDLVFLLARPPYPVRVFRRMDAARAWLASV